MFLGGDIRDVKSISIYVRNKLSMNILRKKYYYGVLTVVFAVIFGCSTGAKNITEDNVLKIEREASDHAFIMDVAIFQAGDELSIWGSVKRHHSGRATVKGHVDAYLLDSTGSVIVKEIVPFHRITERKGKARFHFKVKLLPPPDGTLRIVHHNAPRHDA
jgi:hypothetical protein